MVEEIKDYWEAKIGPIVGDSAGSAYIYLKNPHDGCDAIATLVLKHDILTFAQAYLGCRVIVKASKLVWTSGRGSAIEEGLPPKPFHYDVTSFASLNLLVYLTDVDETSGPHEVIVGTHRVRSGRKLLSRYLDETDFPEFFPATPQADHRAIREFLFRGYPVLPPPISP